MSDFSERMLHVQVGEAASQPVRLAFTLDPQDTYTDGLGEIVNRTKGRVDISGPLINFTIRSSGSDHLQLMYRLLTLTDSYLRAESARLKADIFQLERGDADGPLGIYTL